MYYVIKIQSRFPIKYTTGILDLYLRTKRMVKFNSGPKILSASYLPSWLVKVAIIPY